MKFEILEVKKDPGTIKRKNSAEKESKVILIHFVKGKRNSEIRRYKDEIDL